jgi:hypothetical protein
VDQLIGIGTLVADFAWTRRRADEGRLLLGGKEVAHWNMDFIGHRLQKPEELEFAPSFQMLPQLRSMPVLDVLGKSFNRAFFFTCAA